MAPPGQLFQRVMQWLANEVIVKGLANNPAFQRFAVRSAESMREASKTAAEAARALSESQGAAQVRGEADALRKRANDMASALREEITAAARDAVDQMNSQSGPKKPPQSGR